MEFQKLVLSTLAIMKADLDNVTRNISTLSLSRTAKPNEEKAKALSDLGLLQPAATEDGLQRLEHKLFDSKHRNQLVRIALASTEHIIQLYF